MYVVTGLRIHLEEDIPDSCFEATDASDTASQC